jgi:hypothetical protein
MTRLALLFVLVAAPAFAQTPLALPQFADPPESNGAPFTTFNRHILWNSGQVCLQRSTSTSWQCLSTAAQTETARASAVSQAVSQAASSAAAIYMTTATGNAGFAAANARIDTVQASIPTVVPDTVCATTTIPSAIVIPALGLSPVYTTPSAGLIPGAPCVVGSTGFIPLGGAAKCIATSPTQMQMRFEGALLTFPAGVYKQCLLVRP